MYKVINTDETTLPKYVAARDAQQRSAANSKLYNATQHAAVNALYARVCAAYDTKVYKNFREQFMCVKVHKPSNATLLSQRVRELDYYAAQNNIAIVRSKTAVLYRIAA